MLTLAGQVQRASDTAKFAVVRVGGVKNEAFADDEKSFADLEDRIARTRRSSGGCRGRRSTPGPRRWSRRGSAAAVTIGGQRLCAAVRAAELPLPCDHRLRHPADAGVALGKNDYIGPLGG